MTDTPYGAMRKRASAARVVKPSGRPGLRGDPSIGRIVKLFIGQGYGFIRLGNDRDVFFHRADVEEGTSFNNLRMGDLVSLELFDDTVSGARALYVRPRNRPR
jgi:cold shock CspA family protein